MSTGGSSAEPTGDDSKWLISCQLCRQGKAENGCLLVAQEFDHDNVLLINDVPRLESEQEERSRGGRRVHTNEGVDIVKTVKARTG